MITVIANLKGGSGKSTVAFNLAVWLEQSGHRVVGYDLWMVLVDNCNVLLHEALADGEDAVRHLHPKEL